MSEIPAKAGGTKTKVPPFVWETYLESHPEVQVELLEIEKYLQVLMMAPGINPILTSSLRGVDSLPDAGWVVTADVDPGKAGSVQIHRYNDGTFEAALTEGSAQSLKKYGELRLRVNFSERATYAFAYTDTPSYFSNREPRSDANPVSQKYSHYTPENNLGNSNLLDFPGGGQMIYGQDSVIGRGGLFTTLIWEDYSRLDNRKGLIGQRSAHFNRVTTDEAELIEIITHLGVAMGLESQELEAYLSVLEAQITPSQP